MTEQKPVTPQQPGKKPEKPSEKDKKRLFLFFLIPIAFFLGVQMFTSGIDVARVSYSEFYSMLLANKDTRQIISAKMIENVIQAELANGKFVSVIVPQNDPDLLPLLRQAVPSFTLNAPQTFLENLIYSLLPVLLLIGFFWFFVYRGMQQGGGKLFSFGKSRAKQSVKDATGITFKDVAGADEAKEDLTEIIDFLKDPQRFQKLGGRIPKGVLLMGPPGTGKTLLAKAVAGEANVPFFSISGSDFVEMFVGVGASRVRDLFEQGKKASKESGRGAILFIDEIDAVGRQRFAGVGGGHDEREQTLNALLVEMDGFDTHTGVILLGSTNRPDVLDPALLRPGRFDRQIVVDRPDVKGREEVLQVHVKKIKLDDACDLATIAKQTPGFSGADLANLVNESALLAARRKKDMVTQQELEESIERVMIGPERKSRVISDKEKEIKAVHESGHALVAHLIPGADPVHKVSIIPRGMGVGGYTMQLPVEDKNLITKQELLDRIAVLLGGRVAEEIVFNEITSGASDDIKKATQFAHAMVCELGMSDKLGNVTFGKKQEQVFLGRDLMHERDYSEQTAVTIDEEVRRIVDESHDRAKKLVGENKDKLKKISDLLLKNEVIDYEDIVSLVGTNGKAPDVSEPSNAQTSTEGPPNTTSPS